MHDLIVVGAGPIGCYLAGKFADKGLDVLVLEEHDEIGKPVACSGHVSNLLWNFVPREENIIENKINGANFHLKNKNYIFEKDETHSYVINRKKLDGYMSRLAEEKGAKILTSHRVKEVFNTDSHVTVYAKHDGEIKNFKGKLLAGCDGVHSTVRKCIDFKDIETREGLFCYVNGQDSGKYVDVYPSKTRDFFAWRIPRGEIVEYGLASKYSEENYENLLSFLKEFKLDKSNAMEFHSGSIPTYLSDGLSKGRTFLVGDSGGMIKPFTGGGIIYGLTAANLASKLISPKNQKSLKSYERAVKEVLGNDIRMGKLLNLYYRLPQLLQERILRIVNVIIDDFHMDKPTDVLLNLIKKGKSI